MRINQRTAGLILALILCFIFTPAGFAQSGEEKGMELVPKSITRFSNTVSHYVVFDIEFREADRLVLRVYNPEGRQVSFKTRQINHYNQNAVKAVHWDVKRTDTSKSGIELFFKKGCAAGSWTITVTAQDAQKNALDEASLEVNVRDKDSLECVDYERAHEMLLSGREPVEEGKVRLVSQLPTDRCFVKELWKNKAYDLTGDSAQMCTRAVFSMAVSYLGLDCSPVRMSEITRSSELFYTYEEVAEKLGGIRRREGTVEELWDVYQAGNGSPVCIHFTYAGNGMHALVLIARDSGNPELYYAVNSSAGVNASSAGGLKHDHVIPILIDEGKKGCMIRSPLAKAYNTGRLDSIWCWEKTE